MYNVFCRTPEVREQLKTEGIDGHASMNAVFCVFYFNVIKFLGSMSE